MIAIEGMVMVKAKNVNVKVKVENETEENSTEDLTLQKARSAACRVTPPPPLNIIDPHSRNTNIVQ